MNVVFPSSIKNNSTRKSSQVNPSGVSDVWAVELQSCTEFESKSHLTSITGSSQPEMTVDYLVKSLI